MALLRLSYFPSTFSFHSEYQQQQQQQKLFTSPSSSSQNSNLISKYSNSNLSLSWSPSSNSPPSHTLSLKTKRTSKFKFHFSSTTQEQALETQTETETEEFSRTRLIAQNVPWTCTHEDIRALFEKFGKVLDVELSMYSKTKNRGLAFVTMGSPEEALTALNNLESYEFEGRTLYVTYARPKKEKPAPVVQPKPVTFNLFVANLPFDARAKDLKEFFDSGSGNVVSAQIIFHDNPKRSLGYGFVGFKTKKDAEEALSTFQEKIFMGRPIRLARGKQFVKVPTDEEIQSETTSTDDDVEQVETANVV